MACHSCVLKCLRKYNQGSKNTAMQRTKEKQQIQVCNSVSSVLWLGQFECCTSP